MYGCESWTVKKAEHWKIDAFELWCLRRLLRVPWTARRSNRYILEEISPGCSLEGLMLSSNSSTLATSCKILTHWNRPWCWEGLGAGEEGDDRGWDGIDGHEFEWIPGVGDGQGGLVYCSSWGHKESDMIERLNWTEDTVGLDFPGDSDGKESACSARDLALISGSGRSPGEGNEWLSIPAFLPGKFHGQRSLVGYSPWGRKELDMIEQLTLSLSRYLRWVKNKRTLKKCKGQRHDVWKTKTFLRVEESVWVQWRLEFGDTREKQLEC